MNCIDNQPEQWLIVKFPVSKGVLSAIAFTWIMLYHIYAIVFEWSVLFSIYQSINNQFISGSAFASRVIMCAFCNRYGVVIFILKYYFYCWRCPLPVVSVYVMAQCPSVLSLSHQQPASGKWHCSRCWLISSSGTYWLLIDIYCRRLSAEWAGSCCDPMDQCRRTLVDKSTSIGLPCSLRLQNTVAGLVIQHSITRLM